MTGDELRVKGEQLVIITINGETYAHEFCVCDLATDADVIVGTDFLKKMDASLDFERGKLWLRTARRVDHDPLRGRRSESRGTAARAAHTVFSRADGRGRQKSYWIGCKKRDELSPKQTETFSPEIEMKSSDSWLVKTTQNIRIPYGSSRW